MRVDLIADASPAAGLGHSARVLAVASALERQQQRFRVLVTGEAGRALAARSNLAASVVSEESLAAHFASAPSPDVVVLDGYGFANDLVGAVRRTGAIVAQFEDTGIGRVDADIVIAPDITNDGGYVLVPGSRTLLGPAYLPIRTSLRHENVAINQRELLVSLGSAPSQILLRQVLALVEGLDQFDTVQVVVGSAYEGDLRCADRRTTFVRDPANPFRVYQPAGLAICGGGMTSAELCWLGVPQIVVCLAANQKRFVRAITHAGAAIFGGTSDDLSPLPAALRQGAASRARERMRHAAHQFIDGHGAERIADALLEAWRSDR